VTIFASEERVVVGGDALANARAEAKRWYSTIVLKGWSSPVLILRPQ
jgi:hypothetical protein